MTCQLCLSANATSHVTERHGSGQFLETHYCQSCCAAKYLKSANNARTIPRPGLTLALFLALVASFAVPNVLVTCAARSGAIHRPPDEVRHWIVSTFLTVNVCFVLILAYFVITNWLRRLLWYKRTGGVVPMPRRWQVFSSQNLTWLSDCCIGIAGPTTALLTYHARTGKESYFPLLPLIASVLLLVFIGIAWKHPKTRPLLDAFRDEWKRAPWLERALMVVAPLLSWPTYLMLSAIPMATLLFWRVNAWYLLPFWLTIVLGCRVLFTSCVVVAAQPR